MVDMKKGGIIAGIIIVFVVIFLVIGGNYNSLVSKEEKVSSELSNIDVMLKRRTDLIPNLVNTVKGYMKHESDIIDKVTEARKSLVSAQGTLEKSKANEELTKSLNALMVVVENYPELKSNENFIQLQDEIAGTENRIAVARKDYNNAVNEYNTAIKKFPANLFAGMFGFKKAEYFGEGENYEEVPDIEF